MLAKDILKFHCVIWPALLLAAGYDVPRRLFVHGYLLLDEQKMSKSLGNVIDPLELIDVYGVDAVRFYLFRAVSFGQDGTISVEGLHERYERELGNDLGNLLSRTTAMIARYRGGRLAHAPGEPPWQVDALRDGVARGLDEFDLTGALDSIWQLVRELNRYVEDTAPWQLAKDDARSADLDRVLYDLVDGLCAIAIAVYAYLPDSSERILGALGQPLDYSWNRLSLGVAVAADGIEPAQPLFPRIESSEAA
jgi:methionyl-tRNA synthetase